MKTEVPTSPHGELRTCGEVSKGVARVGQTRGCSTEMTISNFGDVGKRVTLVGRLDILGCEKIDLPLAVVAGSGTHNAWSTWAASTSLAHLRCAISCSQRRPSRANLGPSFCLTRGHW
jgi:hypothetical protein